MVRSHHHEEGCSKSCDLPAIAGCRCSPTRILALMNTSLFQETDSMWYVMCLNCNDKGPEQPTKKLAVLSWNEQVNFKYL